MRFLVEVNATPKRRDDISYIKRKLRAAVDKETISLFSQDRLSSLESSEAYGSEEAEV